VQEEVLAAGKSTAAALGGWIIFEDETHQSLRPPLAGGRTAVHEIFGCQGGGRQVGSCVCRPEHLA
jgi:hypothetical protein